MLLDLTSLHEHEFSSSPKFVLGVHMSVRVTMLERRRDCDAKPRICHHKIRSIAHKQAPQLCCALDAPVFAIQYAITVGAGRERGVCQDLAPILLAL